MKIIKERLITLILTVSMIIIGLPFLSFAENVDNEVNVEDKSEDIIEDNEGRGDLIEEENQDDEDGRGDLIDDDGKGDLIDEEENENLEEPQKEEQWNIYYKDKENQKELLQSKTIKSTNNEKDIINDNMEHIDGYKYVKTGDYNNLLLWIGITAVAVIILFAVMIKNKK